MRSLSLIAVAFLSVLASLAVAASPELTCDPLPTAGQCPRLDASIVELLARPEKFDKRLVRIEGYMKLEFEGNAIYLHKEDAEVGMTRNGFWLSLDKRTREAMAACKGGSYVSIEGRFVSGENGHMGLWSGTISDISRCVPLK